MNECVFLFLFYTQPRMTARPTYLYLRPQFFVRTADVTGSVQLPEGTEMVMPGDTVSLTIDVSSFLEGRAFLVLEEGVVVRSQGGCPVALRTAAVLFSIVPAAYDGGLGSLQDKDRSRCLFLLHYLALGWCACVMQRCFEGDRGGLGAAADAATCRIAVLCCIFGFHCATY